MENNFCENVNCQLSVVTFMQILIEFHLRKGNEENGK
jgi:hypothetical protein